MLLSFALLLLIPSNNNELVVSIQYKESQSVTKTLRFNEVTIGEMRFETPIVETESAPTVKPSAVIHVDTPFRAVRVKSFTTPTTKINSKTWCIDKPGKHLVDIVSIGFEDGEIILLEREVTVEIQTTEPDEDEPEPNPDDDDEPEPAGKSIIGGPGFRVLIVYETADILNRDQLAILGSQTVRQFLNNKCTVDNGTPAWRQFDPDTKFEGESIWKDALARPRDKLPWLIISNTKGSFEGPLPANVSEAMELLKEYEAKK